MGVYSPQGESAALLQVGERARDRALEARDPRPRLLLGDALERRREEGVDRGVGLGQLHHVVGTLAGLAEGLHQLGDDVLDLLEDRRILGADLADQQAEAAIRVGDRRLEALLVELGEVERPADGLRDALRVGVDAVLEMLLGVLPHDIPRAVLLRAELGDAHGHEDLAHRGRVGQRLGHALERGGVRLLLRLLLDDRHGVGAVAVDGGRRLDDRAEVLRGDAVLLLRGHG